MESDSCVSVVFVESKSLPDPCAPFSITCIDTINVSLDAAGNASLNPEDFVGAPQAGVTYFASQTNFSCDDLGFNSIFVLGTNDVTMESDSCVSVVFVESKALPDPCAPFSITCIDSITVALKNSGKMKLQARDLVTDFIPSLDYNLSQEDFNCDDIGTTTIIVTVTDRQSGLSSQCSTVVTILPPAKGNKCDKSFHADKVLEQHQVSIAPNPFSDFIKVHSVSEDVITKIVVRDLQGKVIIQELYSFNNTIDASHIESGIYLIQIEYEDGSWRSEKIIKLE